jgi:hypothetical protein
VDFRDITSLRLATGTAAARERQRYRPHLFLFKTTA